MEVFSGGSYTGAGTGRVTRLWNPASTSADTTISMELPALRARSRDETRNNPIAGGAIHTIVARTVGTGLALQCRPDRDMLRWSETQAATWKKTVEREFALFSRFCDLAERHNLYELQSLVFRGVLESGDVFTVLPAVDDLRTPYQLKLQVLEADRIGNPGSESDGETLTAGVRFNPRTGAPSEFHVYARHPGGGYLGKDALEGVWVPARTARGTPAMLHHLRITRPGQSRGVPHLAPVMTMLKQLGRYTDAEIMAAVISGYFSVFIQSEDTGDPITGQTAPVTSTDVAGNQEIAMGPGLIVGLPPGSTANSVNPGRPNTAFDPFVQSILRQIGVGLEIPFELLVKHFTASYSASRAALLDGFIFFRGRRDWLATSFCQPVYEAFLEEAVAMGRISAPGFFSDPVVRAAYCRADWTGDSAGALDPVKEVEAYVLAIDNRLCTRERAEMELFGTDFGTTLDQKSTEEKKLKTAGLIELPAPPAAGPGGPARPPTPDNDTENA